MNKNLQNNINWFPGHMAKAKRKLQEHLKSVDIVAEIIDARIPHSSKNSDLENIISGKPRLLLLNKSDMADAKETTKWLNYFQQHKINTISFSILEKKCVKNFSDEIKNILKDKLSSWSKKGINNRKIRVMVVGIPNVGKSSFINKLIKSNKAMVQNKPGITRSNHWFLVGNEIEILDTPGILPPKIENETTAKNLAFTGAIKDEILNLEEIAAEFLDKVGKNYSENLINRYNLEKENFLKLQKFEKLETIGKKRRMLISGGKVDLERIAKTILTDFRNLKLGKITLEKVNSTET